MPREVPKCELEEFELNEEYFLDLRAFLEDIGLTCLEAQMIVGVYRYPEHHVDILTLKKREIPAELLENEDFDRAVSGLLNSGFLKPYESKKPEMCVKCDDQGWLVAEDIIERCYSHSLKYYPQMCEHFKDLETRRCIDHEHFKKGAKRVINTNHSRLEIEVERVLTSDIIVSRSEDGLPIYGRRLIGKIWNCPRCKKMIPLNYTYDDSNLYTENLDVKCPECCLNIVLGRCLKWACIK